MRGFFRNDELGAAAGHAVKLGDTRRIVNPGTPLAGIDTQVRPIS
jgi:hypothetical protein